MSTIHPLTLFRSGASAMSCCSRREFIRTAAGVMIGGALSSTPARAQGGAASRVAAGDLLVKVGDASLTPLRPDDVPAGATLMAWPLDPASQAARSGVSLNRLVLVKVDASALTESTRRRAAEGVVAYSAVCTHSGCDVSDWNEQERALVCPCHASMFDPLDGGQVIDGPAPRALPALPLVVKDGRLVVAGPFTSAPGFDPA